MEANRASLWQRQAETDALFANLDALDAEAEEAIRAAQPAEDEEEASDEE